MSYNREFINTKYAVNLELTQETETLMNSLMIAQEAAMALEMLANRQGLDHFAAHVRTINEDIGKKLGEAGNDFGTVTSLFSLVKEPINTTDD